MKFFIWGNIRISYIILSLIINIANISVEDANIGAIIGAINANIFDISINGANIAGNINRYLIKIILQVILIDPMKIRIRITPILEPLLASKTLILAEIMPLIELITPILAWLALIMLILEPIFKGN